MTSVDMRMWVGGNHNGNNEWRYLLPMFHNSRRNNYTLESLHALFQHDFSLLLHLVMELMWGRFVNVHGIHSQWPPHGAPQQIIKDCTARIGSKQDWFDSENGVTDISRGHRATKTMRDMKVIMKHLENVFEETPARMYRS